MDDLMRLLAYRAWARERVLGAAQGMPSEDLTKPVVSSFGSVRDTLVHVLSADVTWTSRLGGVSPSGHLRPEDYPDVPALRTRWEQVDRDLGSQVAGSDPGRMVIYRTTAGVEHRQPVWQIVQHLINHQTYHFGQISTLLRQLGASPAATDLIVFDRK